MQLRFPNEVTPQTESQLTKHNNNKLNPPQKTQTKNQKPQPKPTPQTLSGLC